MNFPIYIGRTRLFQTLGVLGGIFEFKFQKNSLWANSGDTDQTPRFAASDLGLWCFPLSHKKDARLIWI